MQALLLPETFSSAKVTLDSPQDLMNDELYFAFCEANPNLRIERTAGGEILILARGGGNSSFRSLEVSGELRSWARKDRRGHAFESSAEFILPSGAALSPDAAWVSNESLSKLTRNERRQFLKLCPEFVIEVMSPSDRLSTAKNKMEEWRRNGVELGWLIDGDNRTVYVYRGGETAFETVVDAMRLSGEGPVAGFELDLTDIWAGLDVLPAVT